jgi:hypothetical protein
MSRPGNTRRFSLIVAKSWLRYFVKSNILVLLLVVNPRSNEIAFAWGDSIQENEASTLRNDARVLVDLTPTDDAGMMSLRSRVFD